MAATRRNAGKSETRKGKEPAPTRRRLAVLVSLVAALTLTSALLLALAPAPINLQASSSLFAIEAPQSLDAVFDSVSVPLDHKRWHYVYLHHSASVSGSAQTIAEAGNGLPDHFVIGNGEGTTDGEIQIGQRWTQQLAPGITRGANYILPDCISICLVGDFGQAPPTATQQRRVAQLVSALQGRLHIPRDRVFFDVRNETAAGIGRYFPTQRFQAEIIP